MDRVVKCAPARRSIYWACFLHWLWIAVLIVGSHAVSLGEGPASWRLAVGVKVLLEVVFAFFLVGTILKCVDYRLDPPAESVALSSPAAPPPTAILYLCCGDLDEAALHSLARMSTGGELALFVHDDAGNGSPGPEVVAAVRRVAQATGMSIALESRPLREGGKPGAVNWMLERIPSRFELLLLADSDSYALGCENLPAAMARFQDPDVAAVQFRNTGVLTGEEGSVARVLTRAIDVFDIFAVHQARHGLMPFLGHNGLLRRSALRDVGGFTPGTLSDDVDLTVRFALVGLRVEYAREVLFGETVPATYTSFRRRARKWAVGCTQVLRKHLVAVLRSRRMTLKQKLGFLEFSGFYGVQVLVLGYLALAYIALPLLRSDAGGEVLPAFLAGSIVSASILAPAWMQAGGPLQRLAFGWRCALAYGSLAFATTHGVLEGMIRGGTEWVPTGGTHTGSRFPATTILEVAFGLSIFVVPLFHQTVLLAMPSTYLFAVVYLSVPLLAILHRPLSAQRGHRTRVSVVLVSAATTSAVVLAGMAFGEDRPDMARSRWDKPSVVTRKDRILVNGRPFFVRGIHYSPFLPRTGPREGSWPDDLRIEKDFAILEDLGVNTILVHDAPPRVLDLARQRRFEVIYAFTVNWQSIADEGAFQEMRREIGARASQLSGHPALLYYLIGNEIPEWIVAKLGKRFLAERIGILASAVKEQHPAALVSHANWPPTKDVDLSWMDVVSFNLYPSWPREVAVRGYGPYLRDVLAPLAAGRPLVITEFGQNTLEADEARQGEVLRQCWEPIRTQTSGGVVFSFADEWWKNYDNPRPGGGYWEREFAPQDPLVHDQDPEEYYGILTSEREKKLAYTVVRDFLREPDTDSTAAGAGLRRLVLLGFFGLAMLMTAYVFWPKRARAHR